MYLITQFYKGDTILNEVVLAKGSLFLEDYVFKLYDIDNKEYKLFKYNEMYRSLITLFGVSQFWYFRILPEVFDFFHNELDCASDIYAMDTKLLAYALSKDLITSVNDNNYATFHIRNNFLGAYKVKEGFQRRFFRLRFLNIEDYTLY